MQNLLPSLVDIKLRSFGGFEASEHVARYAVAKVPRGPVFREPWRPDAEDGLGRARAPQDSLPRKEVIQPHLPVRLPCYDFTPLTLHTFDASAPRRVRPAASGADDSGGVTGGVYKARERIHRGVLIRDY